MLKQEEMWLKGVQKQFARLISNPKWDCIELTSLQLDLVTHIMRANSVKELSPSINERVTDMLIETIKEKFKKVKFVKNKAEEDYTK